ncbi:YdcF family protein [Azospirillum sp. RWY-5-1]|uniref:YdcF family protein n=2 Tax=Azospirillum oleiclasticum TaxID=2735135 RepID=A0ABX2T7V4_9PROT|nr:YdcF family protein [Azospirillum oleiclasticum]NYZ19233.1 YdcF family protein [Azospirillum oleiclasticum]
MPGNLLALLLAVGAVLLFAGNRLRRLGRWLVAAAAVAFAMLLVTPVGDWAARPLEERFARPALPDRVDGIIMLGGAVDPMMAASRGEPSVNQSTERILAFVELARRYPDARLVSSGGSGLLRHPDAKEDAVVRAVFGQIGFDTGRVLFETESRNTWENALFSRDLVKPEPGEVWLLVTSALHMPRSVGIFRRIGWPVIPYPVDYRSFDAAAPYAGFEVERTLVLVTAAVREWIGLAAYRLMDRTPGLFPGAE